MPVAKPVSVEDSRAPESGVGAKLRAARLARGYGVRELARLVKCSASLISQVEQGKANPSVNTLYEITNVLEISMDSIFSPHDSMPRQSRSPGKGAANGNSHARTAASTDGIIGGSIIQHPDTRMEIVLNNGVRWELLTPTTDPNVEFMEVTYNVGASSAAGEESVRHNGREYSVIIEGTLHAQIGFDTYVLNPGDSLAFDPTIPHRFWNEGTIPMRAIWCVLDRWVPSEELTNPT
jgi:transcriptional regulator with XRE-family HTH domain/quercetin dioxygenase-like cupin family protein